MQSHEDYEWECLQQRIERDRRSDVYDKKEERVTPCQKLGYKVGDEFVIERANSMVVGKKVTLYEDDGTETPFFYRKDLGMTACYNLDRVRKIKDADEQDDKIDAVEDRPDLIVQKEHEWELLQQGKEKDAVNHPDHYTQGGIECIDAIKASMSYIEYLGYLKGNCQKYIWRYRNKGNMRQDLAKAKWYLEELEKEVGNE